MAISTKVKNLTLHTAGLITKRLKIKTTAGKRKVVVSSNFLNLMDFHPGDRVVERVIGPGRGYVIERAYDLFDQGSTKQVYSREYKRRKNNPTETLVETSSKKIIESAIPANCSHVHVSMERGRITVKPVTSHVMRALNNALSAEDAFSTFVACTSGVDCHSLMDNGFTVHSVLEWRPPEARDQRDLSETGALNVLANIPGIRNLFNENIMEIDTGLLAEAVLKSPFTFFHASPQCDDHSTAKAPSLKKASEEDLTTSLDMGYDILRMIETMAPPAVLLENVGGWISSGMYKILEIRMRRMGYRKFELVGDARSFGGRTSRKRAYSFFTCLPGEFAFEDAQPFSVDPIWPVIEKHLPDCRHVSHSRSLQAGLKSGRLRLITRDSTHCPTIMKSQDRMAKDSVVIMDDGELYFPSEGLLKELMGISPGFSLDAVSGSIASEIIGQSIDVPFHESILRSIKRHIESFFQSQKPKLSF